MMKLIAGRSNPALSFSISQNLNVHLSDNLLSNFSDGETRFELEHHVRGEQVFIIQSTCAPANDHIMELALMADAVSRSDAGRVIGVLPYYGYSRSDRRPDHLRTPIASKLVAKLLMNSGIDYIITIDIHSKQQQGFFDIPFVNLTTTQLFTNNILSYYGDQDIVMVSPDVGGVARTTKIAKGVEDAPLAIIDKRRPMPNVAEVHNIIGDVEGKTCIIVDDLIDTAGTLRKASHALKEEGGAKNVVAYIAHPVLSGRAIDNIAESALDELVVTDTIPLSAEGREYMTKTHHIRLVSVADLVSECIKRVYQNDSISNMYKENKE